MNTTSITAGTEYFPKDAANRFYANISFSKYFPVFNATMSYGRKYGHLEIENDVIEVYPVQEKKLKAGVSIPLNFSKSVYLTKLKFSSNYIFASENYPEDTYDHTISKNYEAIEFGLNFINSKQRARRDIQTKWAQQLLINYQTIPSNNGYQGSQLISAAQLNFPGIAKHHGSSLAFTFEESKKDYVNSIYDITLRPRFIPKNS